ncbi:MAG: hypothetical protein HYS70_06490, partial [Nitrospinae bacterium]|nr:hypothetical protein [Nitrospinota bacterium]
GARLAQAILSLMGDPSRLQEMGEQARELGRMDAAEQLVNLGYELVECKDAATGAFSLGN